MLTTYQSFAQSLRCETTDGHEIKPDDVLYYMRPSEVGRFPCKILVTRVLGPIGFEATIVDGFTPLNDLVVSGEELDHVTYANTEADSWEGKGAMLNDFRKAALKQQFTMHYMKGSLHQGKAKVFRNRELIMMSWEFVEADAGRKEIRLKVKTSEEGKSFSFAQEVGNDYSFDTLFSIARKQIDRPLNAM